MCSNRFPRSECEVRLRFGFEPRREFCFVRRFGSDFGTIFKNVVSQVKSVVCNLTPGPQSAYSPGLVTGSCRGLNLPTPRFERRFRGSRCGIYSGCGRRSGRWG